MINLTLQPDRGLIEIKQTYPFRFTLGKFTDTKNVIACTPLAKCRDFLMDLLYANSHPSELGCYNLYGMEYDVNKNPTIDFDKAVVVVDFLEPKYVEEFKKNIEILHKIEKFNGLKRTQWFETQHPNILIIVGSKAWIQKTLLLNVYTLLIKLCIQVIDPNVGITFRNLKDKTSIEFDYICNVGDKFINSILENIKYIAKFNTKYVDLYDKVRDIGSIHSASGIVSMYNTIKYCKNVCEAQFSEFAKYISAYQPVGIFNPILKEAA